MSEPTEKKPEKSLYYFRDGDDIVRERFTKEFLDAMEKEAHRALKALSRALKKQQNINK